MTDRSYVVRLFVEGVDAESYRSVVVASSPLEAALGELENIRDVDPAGLLEGRAGAVVTVIPLDEARAIPARFR